MRYPTVGDWWIDGKGNLEVRVADMKNTHYEWFVAEHEINEALLCIRDGVDEKIITEFDIVFEKLREQYPELIGDQEPGNMVSAPYNKQHLAATNIEMLTCWVFKEDWGKYDDAINSLY